MGYVPSESVDRLAWARFRRPAAEEPRELVERCWPANWAGEMLPDEEKDLTAALRTVPFVDSEEVEMVLFDAELVTFELRAVTQ